MLAKDFDRSFDVRLHNWFHQILELRIDHRSSGVVEVRRRKPTLSVIGGLVKALSLCVSCGSLAFHLIECSLLQIDELHEFDESVRNVGIPLSEVVEFPFAPFRFDIAKADENEEKA